MKHFFSSNFSFALQLFTILTIPIFFAGFSKKKGVQDRWTEVLNFANQIFSWQNTQSDVKFADYAEGFSEVSVYFECLSIRLD